MFSRLSTLDPSFSSPRNSWSKVSGSEAFRLLTSYLKTILLEENPNLQSFSGLFRLDVSNLKTREAKYIFNEALKSIQSTSNGGVPRLGLDVD